MGKRKEYPCGIIIREEEKRYYVNDNYNSFSIVFEKKMIKHFYSSIILISRICEGKGWQNISYHQYQNQSSDSDFVTREIVKSYRDDYLMNGNYFDVRRKDKMLECLENFFKIKNEELIVPSLDNLRLQTLLLIMRYKNEKD